MTDTAAAKGAHFVQMCSERNVPLIFLHNTVAEANPDSHGLFFHISSALIIFLCLFAKTNLKNVHTFCSHSQIFDNKQVPYVIIFHSINMISSKCSQFTKQRENPQKMNNILPPKNNLQQQKFVSHKMFLFQLIRTCKYSCYICVNRDSVIMSQWKGVLYSRCPWRELCT